MKRRTAGLDTIIRGVERASAEPIPELVGRARLDTVYFLDRREVAHAAS